MTPYYQDASVSIELPAGWTDVTHNGRQTFSRVPALRVFNRYNARLSLAARRHLGAPPKGVRWVEVDPTTIAIVADPAGNAVHPNGHVTARALTRLLGEPEYPLEFLLTPDTTVGEVPILLLTLGVVP